MSIEIPAKYEGNSKYEIGVIELKQNSAKLITKNENQKLLIDKDNLNGAYNGDIVIVQKIFNPRARFKAKVIEVLKSQNKEVLCYVENNQLFSIKENVNMKSISFIQKNGDIVLCDNEKVLKVIGNIEDPFIDETISLLLYNEDYRHSKNDYEKITEGTTQHTRVDLTHLPFCTIDPASAKDHDDAIYYDDENEILYVAIADVSAFVEQDSQIDKEAKKRALSMYLPGKVLPMLPAFLSEDLCSLKPDVERFAFVFAMYIDKNNSSIIKSELFEATINSKRKFSYGRIDRVLDGQLDQHTDLDKQIFKSLASLYKVTKSFKHNRLRNGYDFRTTELRLVLNNKSLLETVSKETSSPSHSLVEECMLLANIEAAKKVGTNGIFRVHDEPTLQKINELITDINLLGLEVEPKKTVHKTIVHAQTKAKQVGLSAEVDELIIKSQQQAHYSSSNGGHFGLGFESYSHFTSPIRRYSDLVLHRMLKTKSIPKDIDSICENISTQERNITSCVWDYEDRKYARWAKNNLYKEFMVKLVDIEKGIVELIDGAYGAKATVTNYKGQKLFSKFKVKLTSSDIYTKKIIADIKY
ncbi:MAG: VacB/RNase II family 3'-5' exoribonuclease [Campylobacteraceae bacterium]|jgi:ribonuclease R|nr:VacB/RNase II family 3'-5' exoribonuclease [Campylobacteraceae bacterium]MBT3882585.1 VacB/RNase II family 3'-5' exoribonuclease [Campylobacteraceae bacterium]MBT4030381.1 VacB/RNase II family 3'-5' exoribonuclease [Campylobacteraceae bacterium]MBT4179742.1 VacB/RNase II family 3'-5' exoribonuclease [Campylobacteraceae bacterium]MBT4572614.1 VacB/RNase II family 3'-5' exoribonuclease [Campylobacteraceae bacterium]